MKFKIKITIIIGMVCSINLSFAEFMIKVPLETDLGGALPKNSIVFKADESTPIPPPEEPAKPIDCEDEEQIKDNPEECETRLTGWEQFVTDHGFDGENIKWNNILNGLDLGGRGISELPTVPYPVSSVSYELNLHGNNLTNVNALISIQSATYLYLEENGNLTNISGLINLTTVKNDFFIGNNNLSNLAGLNNLESVGGTFDLANNRLTNINGLSSLTNVGKNLVLDENELTNLDGLINLRTVGNLLYIGNNMSLQNINGLSNVSVGGKIRIRDDYKGSKLSASSIFCTTNASNKFQSGYAQKSAICES